MISGKNTEEPDVMLRGRFIVDQKYESINTEKHRDTSFQQAWSFFFVLDEVVPTGIRLEVGMMYNRQLIQQ